MFIFSRTARSQDKNELDVEELIAEYAGFAKNWVEAPRYRFWDYALIFRLMRDENYASILDVNLERKYDTCFEILAYNRSYEYEHLSVKELLRSQIHGFKYDVVSCIGTLDHVENERRLFRKLAKHVTIGGLLVITSDNETIAKYKNRSYTPEMLLELSTIIEHDGYEIYKQDALNSTDYLEKKDGLHSIVIQRIGRA